MHVVLAVSDVERAYAFDVRGHRDVDASARGGHAKRGLREKNCEQARSEDGDHAEESPAAAEPHRASHQQ